MQIFLIVALVVALDQSTKLLAKKHLFETGVGQIPVIADWLKFTYTENPGIAFGIRIGGPVVVTIFSLVATIGICYYLYRTQQKNIYSRLVIGLILGGAVGNLIDRVAYGQVIDFIHFDLYNGYLFGRYTSIFPIFNVADAAITTGVGVMLVWYKRIFEPDLPPALATSDAATGTVNDAADESSAANHDADTNHRK
ncbi:MAG: signal peptidase II [Rhizobacter sp.]|nr:signal peptidase II [Chlorobiales bacterium]